MKALSITRPWAELILRGKSVENRTWSTNHRGPFLLHAAKSWVPEAFSFAAMAAPRVLNDTPMSRDDHPTGIVGIAEITKVCSNEMVDLPDDMSWAPCRCGPWAMAGQYHWKLVNVRRLAEPVPCRGALALWAPPADVLAAVHTRLAEVAS